MMTITDEWDKFAETGRISDYLRYVGATQPENSKELTVTDYADNSGNCNKGTSCRRTG